MHLRANKALLQNLDDDAIDHAEALISKINGLLRYDDASVPVAK